MKKNRTQTSLTNQVSFEGELKDKIFIPFKDTGLKLVGPLDFTWKKFPRPLISGSSCSDYPSMHEKISKFFNQSPKQKEFSSSVMFNSQLAVYENVSFKKSFVQIGGKYLLNGPSGLRFQTAYVYQTANRNERKTREENLVEFFHDQQYKNQKITPESVDPASVRDMDFAIECRNTHNYYHYVTEAMSQLAILDTTEHTGKIFIHSVDADRKRNKFARAFVDAVFPHLSERLEFQATPKHYDAVLSTFNFDQSYYIYGDAAIPSVDELVPSQSTMWKGKTATLSSQNLLKQNVTNTGHVALRKAALNQLEGKDFSYLPKRIFVTRDAGQGRTRNICGGDELFEGLKDFGFVQVAFEKLSPIEQVAIMANAEIMISGHGAGFANMMFADPNTCAIEIGTWQTAVFRWLDFWLHATISECSYRYFAADHDTEDPEIEPSFDIDSIVPAQISENGINAILNYVAFLLKEPLRLRSGKALTILATQLMRSGDTSRALTLVNEHKNLTESSYDLSLLHAELFRLSQMREAAFDKFIHAYSLSDIKPYPLFQTIFLARRKKDWTYISQAINRLFKDHPESTERFMGVHSWVDLEQLAKKESTDFYFKKLKGVSLGKESEPLSNPSYD